jgi:hypothetical protein
LRAREIGCELKLVDCITGRPPALREVLV